MVIFHLKIRQIIYILIAIIILVGLVIGIYFATKPNTQPTSFINSNKVIQYSSDIVPEIDNQNPCSDNSEKYILKSSKSTKVVSATNISTNNDNKYIKLKDDIYLQFDSKRNDIYLIKTNESKTSKTKIQGFYGKVLAYIPSDYTHIVWLDFSKITGIKFEDISFITDRFQNKSATLPEKSFYKIYIHNYTPIPMASISRLDNVMLSNKTDENSFYCVSKIENSVLDTTVGIVLYYVNL